MSTGTGNSSFASVLVPKPIVNVTQFVILGLKVSESQSESHSDCEPQA